MRVKHTAFTMIELIFVIVIMGILGKFGVEFLFHAYNSFINSKVNNELQANSESAVEFIANRLQYRIKDSVIARTGIASPTTVSIADAGGNLFQVLEWIGADNDGFRGTSLPYWSGIIDLDLSNTNSLFSPATNTANENTLIKALSNNSSDLNDSALYFMGSNSDIQSGYGWNGQINDQNQTMHPINSDANLSKFVPAVGTGGFHDVNEYYKLAWSAYAVSMEDFNVTTKMGNLYFYYNFQPWDGEVPTDGNKTLLMQNVSTFQFTSVGSLLKIQICAKSDLLEEYSLCKEKTIF
jgi:prepilin-type N-terminal cleavage/methylation domain-containing protein